MIYRSQGGCANPPSELGALDLEVFMRRVDILKALKGKVTTDVVAIHLFATACSYDVVGMILESGGGTFPGESYAEAERYLNFMINNLILALQSDVEKMVNHISKLGTAIPVCSYNAFKDFNPPMGAFEFQYDEAKIDSLLGFISALRASAVPAVTNRSSDLLDCEASRRAKLNVNDGSDAIGNDSRGVMRDGRIAVDVAIGYRIDQLRSFFWHLAHMCMNDIDNQRVKQAVCDICEIVAYMYAASKTYSGVKALGLPTTVQNGLMISRERLNSREGKLGTLSCVCPGGLNDGAICDGLHVLGGLSPDAALCATNIIMNVSTMSSIYRGARCGDAYRTPIFDSIFPASKSWEVPLFLRSEYLLQTSMRRTLDAYKRCRDNDTDRDEQIYDKEECCGS